ncbi:MAG: hypothetical protein JJ975_09915 [Bacteroidia bacterium]|nr:hypothetical protein [Bacteroidia bacterium]
MTDVFVLILLSAIGCWSYFFWARKKQIVDIPNERSSHTHSPVRGMGLALLAPVLALIWFEPSRLPMLLGVIIAILTGYFDDRIDLRVYIRLPLYFASVVLATYQLFIPMFSETGTILLYAALIVLAVGIVNTYNFMDGINGITGLYTLVFVLCSYFLLTSLSGETTWVYRLVMAVTGFALVFGSFNYRKKALAFLGDSGSVSLGVIVSILLFLLGITVNHWGVIILLSVYGVDSVSTIILRLLRRENIFKAHRSHLYQDLVHVRNWTHMQVAVLYASLQLIINLIFFNDILAREVNTFSIIITLLVLGLAYLLVKKQLGQLTFNKASNE